MEILVCAKAVPEVSEEEIELLEDGSDIARDDLAYAVNEWDNYAVEEAIQLRDKVGGRVTVVSVGDDEAEEILRREMAMGADRGVLLADEAFEGSDGLGIATILRAFVAKERFDLILTGAQADDGAGQVGGMLAAMLDRPFVSLVKKIDVLQAGLLRVEREVEGGKLEVVEVGLPCVLSIQTGINEPRYVGIRGIRKAASMDVPSFEADDLGIDPKKVGAAGSRVRRVSYFVPPTGQGAMLLEGSMEDQVTKLVELLKTRGGIL